jgi:8-amino-7-oxononanoate synthase
MSGLDELAGEIEALRAQGRWRTLRAIDGAQDVRVRVDGREVVNFSANNYLGLANHPALARAAVLATQELGSGAGASRLIAGNLAPHRALEVELADWFGRPAALLFNSGYHANLGVIQALVGRGDAVFSDELNHASIIDGCRLSRADVHVYPHGDLDALGHLLAAHAGRARRRLLVSDSLFSMDGDRADVLALRAWADRYDAALMLDEAHAVGAYGPEGRGVAAAAGCVPDILVGTLGKAMGSFGAFVVGQQTLVDVLVNRARSFVFTTALPPGVVAASRAALALARGREGGLLRAQLATLVRRLGNGSERLGVSSQHIEITHIFPIHIGGDRAAMEASQALLEEGFYAQGIRPPTVPPGTARLRISLMATHTEQDVDALLTGLAGLIERGLVPARETS